LVWNLHYGHLRETPIYSKVILRQVCAVHLLWTPPTPPSQHPLYARHTNLLLGPYLLPSSRTAQSWPQMVVPSLGHLLARAHISRCLPTAVVPPAVEQHHIAEHDATRPPLLTAVPCWTQQVLTANLRTDHGVTCSNSGGSATFHFIICKTAGLEHKYTARKTWLLYHSTSVQTQNLKGQSLDPILVFSPRPRM
jgi:hypothetical protein